MLEDSTKFVITQTVMLGLEFHENLDYIIIVDKDIDLDFDSESKAIEFCDKAKSRYILANISRDMNHVIVVPK